MKLLLAVILVLMSAGLANATYINDNAFGLGNGAYITVNSTTIDDVNQLACCDAGLMLRINGSMTNYTVGTNKTITSVTFNNVTDTFTVPVSGTAGYFNFSAIMHNASNSYNLTADGSFVEARNTSVSGYVWFNYSMTTAKTLVVSWNSSLGGTSQTSSPPVITSNLNNLTGFSDTDIAINVNNTILFSVGANQTITTWTWGGGATKLSGDGTTNSTASKLFSSVGTEYITVYGTNPNGTTQTLTWTVYVLTGGGGGTNWDYLTGTVNVVGATITTNPNVGSTTGGAYSFGYVFVDGQTYWINVSKIGYYDNNTQITFTSDHMIWNPILTATSKNITVITDAATSTSADGAVLNGHFISNTLPVTGYFEYSSAPTTYKYKTTNQLMNANGSFTATIKGMPLISNTKYYYRAVANDSTIKVYGNQVSFMTSSLATIPDYGFDKNFNNLTNSNFDPTNMSQVASSPFTDIVGNVFWGFIFVVIFIMLWLRSEDITIPALLGLIIGGSLWTMMPPEWTQMAASLTVISFAGLIYSLIKGRQ